MTDLQEQIDVLKANIQVWWNYFNKTLFPLIKDLQERLATLETNVASQPEINIQESKKREAETD